MNAILAVAIKEFQDAIRNRWLIFITLIFAVLSTGLTYYGSSVSGETGFISLSSSMASLASLAVFIIPLIALLLGYDSFIGEREAGTLLLLLSYPITRTQLLIGKFIGQGSIITIATLFGFGIAALSLVNSVDLTELVSTFGLFILTAILLGLTFLSLSYVVSLSVNEKSTASGIALLLWFFFVVIFDLAILATLVSNNDGFEQQSLIQFMMFNPTDLFRLVNLSTLDTSDINGILSVAINNSWSTQSLLGLMFVWVVSPLILARTIFNRRTF